MWDDEEEDEEYEPVTASEWSWWTVPIVMANFGMQISASVANACETLTTQLCAAANFQHQQREFRDSVREDLESIKTTQE